MIFRAIGYNLASDGNLLRKIKNITPSGGAAIIDSFLAGCNLTLKISGALKEKGLLGNWHFLHVVITDGLDTCSKTDIGECLLVLLLLSNVIPVQLYKTVFIGIDVNSQGDKLLTALQELGKQSTEYYKANDITQETIKNIFQEIQISLGILSQTNIALLSIKERKFVVLFTIQKSSSMYSKWNKVTKAVEMILQQLGSGLHFANALCFNDSAELLGTSEGS